MKKKAIILGTAVLLIVILSIRLISNKEKIDEKKKIPSTSERTVTVIADRIKKNEISGTLQLAGTTIPKTEVVLQSEIAAQVKEVNFKLGDRVSKGKLLIQLDDRLRFLALENAKLNLSRMEDEYVKTKNLFDGKASSETQLRDAKLNYESAKVTYEQAKKQFEQTKIIAPQNGLINQKMVENGSFVNVGTQMTAIVDISQLKALVNIAEGDVYRIKQGQKAQIKTSVFPGVSFTGEVSFISAKGDKAHNYPVEITINNQPSHQLKSGTFVTVEFNFGGSGSALTLPKTALIGSAKDPKVYVVSNNIASLKKIILGRDFGNSFEVIEGLNEGDAVVMDGQVNLTDGDNVTIINKEAGK